MSWTDERVETLKKMWSEGGQSASQIAKELGGVTRNAVIGKVHRLGLSNRAGGTAEPAAAPPRPSRSRPRRSPRSKRSPRLPQPPPPRAPSQSPPPCQSSDSGAAHGIGQPAGLQPQGDYPCWPTAAAAAFGNEISPPEALASVREVEKKARKISLMDLTERTCKWPIGDPATEHFWFCGLPSQQGKPYCDAHVGVAFQPMSARRDRKR